MAVINPTDAGAIFYRAGLSYHAVNRITLKNETSKGQKLIGLVFVFDSKNGILDFVKNHENTILSSVSPEFAPEIVKPSILVFSKAEWKRNKTAILTMRKEQLIGE